jgi:hypothetical protein
MVGFGVSLVLPGGEVCDPLRGTEVSGEVSAAFSWSFLRFFKCWRLDFFICSTINLCCMFRKLLSILVVFLKFFLKLFGVFGVFRFRSV